ncbi:MAG: hypothetical protein ABSB80_05645 [Methanoregula sp.]|uniref:hypothetical protein n=1 Tax=Methanoregula sp. TaxID=2052170 RepID=UPI003D0DEE94
MNPLSSLSVLVAIVVLCLCSMPASGIIQEVTIRGSVTALDQTNNTLTIGYPQQYGCSYPATGSPVCSYTSLNIPALTGTVPGSIAYSIFKSGDPVVATSLGGAGGSWIGLAKLYGANPGEEYVTDIVGDTGTIPTPLIGDYALDVTTTPDCSACSGTTCTALSSDVKIMSSGTLVHEETLLPRQMLTYNGRNDGSSVAVTFVKGEASSTTCAGRTGMTGPQAVSVYIVNIVPPIGYGQNTPSPGEALTPLPPTIVTTAPVTTAKSGGLPIAVIGALGVLALVVAERKR